MRRSELQIQLDIMQLIGANALPTIIQTSANIGWNTFNTHISYLIGLGYVTRKDNFEYDRRTTFTYELTPEGRKFLTEYFLFAINYPKIMHQISDEFMGVKSG